jgi:predicted DNA-binding helix-hairpin-helix protein
VCILTLVGVTASSRAERAIEPAATVAPPGEIHYFGHVNVNQASAAELERVPGLSRSEIDRILAARARGPITSLRVLHLGARVQHYLSTSGTSDLTKIRKLPLRALQTADAPEAQLAHTAE